MIKRLKLLAFDYETKSSLSFWRVGGILFLYKHLTLRRRLRGECDASQDVALEFSAKLSCGFSSSPDVSFLVQVLGRIVKFRRYI